MNCEEDEYRDKSVMMLANWPELRVLNLGYLNITDTTLAELTGMDKLETLFVDNRSVSDKGLKAICQNMPSLKKIYANGTSISAPAALEAKERYGVSVFR